MTLNERAWAVADELERDAERLRVAVATVGGARVIDCGGAVTGSLRAGLLMARACVSDLAEVSLVPGDGGPQVQVWTDDPLRACMASQYAGLRVQVDRFFAMGSGPMRLLIGREELLAELKLTETAPCAVGVLESRKHVTEDVVAHLVGKLPGEAERLTLLVAPSFSLAGSLQVVARSVETALHKLHELKFDLHSVVSGFGTAPLPPVAADELTALGRTNDAILYGGRVTLWVRADDEVIEAIGPKVPSSASPDHGTLFADLFAKYGDFYKIDPLLFSPADVTLVNLKSGRARTFGRCEPGLLAKSFLGG